MGMRARVAMHVGYGIQTWKVCMGMRVVICMGIGGDGYACWVRYMSMEGLHGYEG